MQKIRVLFEYDDIDAGAGQQKAEHHSRGAATDDAAAGGQKRWSGWVRDW
jgi:hypothetical protein